MAQKNEVTWRQQSPQTEETDKQKTAVMYMVKNERAEIFVPIFR
jgi:hypothetical protein